MSEAYWIDKKGKAYNANQNHITTIVTNPKLFGFTKEYLVDTYEKFGEKMPSEGKARREIIDKAIGTGWIRLRRYRQSWSITISKMDKRSRSLITDWAKQILDRGVLGFIEKDPFMPIKFVALHSRQENKEYTVKSVAKGAILGNSKIVETVSFGKGWKDFYSA